MSTQADLANGLVTSRSYVLCVSGSFSYDDFVTTVAKPFCKLPIGSQVISGELRVITVWNVTTSVIDVGDQVDVDEFLDGIDLETTASTPLVITDIPTTTLIDEINLIVVSTAPAAGVADLFITYVNPRGQYENFE